MDNEYYVPGQSPTPVQPVPPAPEPETPAPLSRFALAKKAFSRSGLGVLVLFLVMQGLGTLIAVVGVLAGTLPEMIARMSDNPGQYAPGTDAFSNLMQLMTEKMQDSILPWSLLGTLVGLVVALIFFRLILRKIPAEPIARRRLTGREYLFMLFVSLGLWGVGAILGNSPAFFGLVNPLDSVMGGGEGILGIFFTVYAMFGAPILEELAFRKLLLDKAHAYGEVPAVFLSAVTFGLFHGNSTQFLLAFMVGLAFATVYLKTGNVWYSISFHMIINTVASLPDIVFEVTGVKEIAGMDAGWGSWILIGLLAVIGTAVTIAGRKHPLLALKRADYLNCNRILFRNPGCIIFIALVSMSVVSMDLLTLLLNLFPDLMGAGTFVWNPLGFLALIPTVLFAAVLIAVLKKVGTRSSMDQTIQE